ncbi:MAG: LysR family transcriptional regulator [Pseudomonadota bacterium]
MNDDISLRHLKTLSLLLDVGTLTQAAQILGVSQPTVSKSLAKLRAHFADPLLVRVGVAMRPTPKAAALAGPLRDLLTASDSLRASTQAFDPAISQREFTCLVTEVGMIEFIPALMRRLEQSGPGLSVRALQLDSRPLEPRLEAGEADVAVAYFPEAAGTLRRQRLYADGYLSVARHEHPRRQALRAATGFWDERHVLMATPGAGRAANRQLDQILSARLTPTQVQVRVPSFLAGAFVASRTDAVATLPARLARLLAGNLNLFVFAPPFNAAPIQIDQFWHPRVHQDQGHRWLRSTIFNLVAASASGMTGNVRRRRRPKPGR